MKATIITCNTMYDCYGIIEGGYHEIHHIHNLQSVEHLIATVCDTVKNNLLYGCKDSVLEDVRIICDNKDAVEFINNNRIKEFCWTEFKPSIEFGKFGM